MSTCLHCRSATRSQWPECNLCHQRKACCNWCRNQCPSPRHSCDHQSMKAVHTACSSKLYWRSHDQGHMSCQCGTRHSCHRNRCPSHRRSSPSHCKSLLHTCRQCTHPLHIRCPTRMFGRLHMESSLHRNPRCAPDHCARHQCMWVRHTCQQCTHQSRIETHWNTSCLFRMLRIARHHSPHRIRHRFVRRRCS